MTIGVKRLIINLVKWFLVPSVLVLFGYLYVGPNWGATLLAPWFISGRTIEEAPPIQQPK